MPNVALYDITGKVIGDIELSENVFGQPVNEPVLHQVVVAHLANCRQGTQSAKTRSEVSGGGKKPYRQKGTGRARQGSTRAPQWTHGGVVFAPKPRDYSQKVNAKVRRVALKSALSSKVADSELIVFDALNIEAPKTKEMVKVLKAVDVEKALIVLADKDAIHQILYNICDNAVKFSTVGGKLRMSFSWSAGETGRNRKAVVKVYNEGQGIPSEDIPFVFDRFYKSDKSRGLDKIKAVVEANAAHPVPQWIDVNRDALEAKVIALPTRDQIDAPVEEQLIVEFYSK